MYRRGERCLGIVAMAGAAVLAAGSPAMAQPAPADESRTVHADVDGDGAANAVTVRKVDDTTQVISFALPGESVMTTAPAEYAVLQTPRVTDVDRDGVAEVAVTIVTGANTQTLRLYKYDPEAGVVAIQRGTEPFTLREGGGATARSGYQCEDTGKGWMLRTVNARYDDETAKFDGTSSWFIFHDNSTSRWTMAPFSDVPADDPRLNLDPTTCAP